MSEHDSQVAVIQWAFMHEVRYPELAMLFAVPNAGKRSIGAARYYLAEGLKSGVPDLILGVPTEKHNGLVIEMKCGKNTVTETQKMWLRRFAHWHWKIAVSYSASEAIEAICVYLKLPVELCVFA